MSTHFSERRGPNEIPHEIQESVDEFTDDVNAALENKTKFVTVTGMDGKKYAVDAVRVGGIKEG